ncbi:MAG: hypothetical protein L0387_42040 [Acidobacteria bacterium]|nr:hypothetical protein [Acidobacteriota bacterium]
MTHRKGGKLFRRSHHQSRTFGKRHTPIETTSLNRVFELRVDVHLSERLKRAERLTRCGLIVAMAISLLLWK